MVIVLTPGRVRAARIIAVVADVLQIAAFPAFAAGWVSPLDDVMDVLVALVLIWLVGWHVLFLPSFVAEIIPGLDLVPTWTAAVWFVTRRSRRVREVEALPADESSKT